ncbi:MAG: hypothetical protein GY772_32845 [bacterium]|nr:hypothetical protein [bacterium]
MLIRPRCIDLCEPRPIAVLTRSPIGLGALELPGGVARSRSAMPPVSAP